MTTTPDPIHPATLADELERVTHERDLVRALLAAQPLRDAEEQARLERIRRLVENEPEALVGRQILDVAGDVLERLLRR